MIDTYLVSADEAALAVFCARFENVIGPVRGRAATKAFTNEDGNEIPAQEAVGDPAKFYACVRCAESLMLPCGGVDLCKTETGVAVCGIWA